MSQNIFTFPAIFERGKESISISFPDIPGCFSVGSTLEEAEEMSRDALALALSEWWRKEDSAIPVPTPEENITLGENESVHLITVNMVEESFALYDIPAPATTNDQLLETAK